MKFYLSLLVTLALCSHLISVQAQLSVAEELNDLRVCEDTPVGTVIFTLEASGGTGPYFYSISNPEFLSYVSVGLNSGELTVNRQFDSETNDFFLVDVLITDFQTPADEYKADNQVIRIENANDNSPIFDNLPYTTEIYEHPWSNNSLITIQASDADGPQPSLFVKDTTSPAYLDGNILMLKPDARLNYESLPVLTVDIVAEDDGEGCQASKKLLSATTTVIINIMDGPDRPPLFLPALVELDENSSRGTKLVTMTAQDQDYSLNWKTSYSIVPDGTAENWFAIDSTTGVISVIGNIDREDNSVLNNQGSFEFGVIAKEVIPSDSPFNNGTDCYAPCQSNTTVTVTIRDINDNAPAFYYMDPNDASSKIEQSQFNATMEENTANLISVPDLSIYVQDVDEGKNAQFSLEIVGSNSDVFEILPAQASTGEASVVIRVKDSEALDYEKVQSFDLQILAKETSTNERTTATATVTIQLTDANDHSPEFSSSLYTANVTEDASEGTVITSLTATDDDVLESNRNVTYTLKPDSILSVFAIDLLDGTVTLVGSLDQEARNLYYVTVTATDAGRRSTTTNLEITVLDANDQTPKFMRSSYSATIKEEATDFTTPFEIVATDKDQTNNPNSEIIYSIVGGDIPDLFEVVSGPSSGEIKPKKPIDLESLDPNLLVCSGGAIDISLIIMAQDQGIPTRSDNVTATITIEDENDHKPAFNSTSYSGSVPEKSDPETEILQVFASDDDACPPNNDVTYQLRANSGDAINAFTIDSQTGILKVRSSDLDRDVMPSYDIEVLAIDSGGDRTTGTTIVNVNITDINDKSPTITTTDFTPSVMENATLNETVWEVTANDSDTSADLSFNISISNCYDDRGISPTDGCGNPFQMVTNVQVGQLVLVEKLDRERIEKYTAEVSVEDLNAVLGDQKVKRSFQLTVEDSNDNPPRFQSITDHLEVNEEVPNAVIGQVAASDPDAGDNGVVIYSVSGEDAKWVSVDPTNGLLTTTNQLIDRETFGDWLNVTVIAKDGGSPPLTQSIELSIRIADVNDNDPVYVGTPYEGEVLENATVGVVVLVVKTTDADVGVHADVVYSILQGNELGQFEINDTTGEVSVKSQLDRERWPSFTLSISAVDNRGSGGNQQTAQATIAILDVNDSPPTFSSSLYQTNFDEDAAVGDVVYILTATDKDVGINADLRYSIIAGNEKDHFEIDSITGVVTLHSSIINDDAQYEIEVMAIDSGENPMNDTCSLVVSVNDVNLNTPEFVNLPTSELITVKENNASNTFVFQVNATDRDRGENGRITYTLTEGKDEFSIDPEDGRITTRVVFNREEKDAYQVTVKAQDNDPIAPRPAEQSFTVTILDVDDNEPIYNATSNEQTMSLIEEKEAGPLPDTIKEAGDADLAENSINYYFITGGSGVGKFSLDSTTRILSSLGPLDRELQAQYDIVITASDNSNCSTCNTNLDDDWETVKRNPSRLHVIIDLIDINDNSPVFSKDLYKADIPFDSQPNDAAIIVQVAATDADDNAVVTYSIDETHWVLNGKSTTVEDVFGVNSVNGVDGNLYLKGALNGNENGHYDVTVKATDNNSLHSSQALIEVGIIKKDETVVLYSRLTTEAFKATEEKFVEDLGDLLNAEVYVDSVVPHEKEDELDLINSDITIHARELNSTSLVPRQDITSQLSKKESNAFLTEYEVTGVGSVSETPVDRTQNYLIGGLIVAGVAIILAILAFTTAIVCMRRKFLRKLGVAKASEAAVREMHQLQTSKTKSEMPNTNRYSDENPIYVQNQNQTIDLDGWLRTQESKDDDDDDVIDDNALNSQDSAIGISDPNTMDDEQGLDDDKFQIDFDDGDNAKLTAALNAANKRRGMENITYIFDESPNSDFTTL